MSKKVEYRLDIKNISINLLKIIGIWFAYAVIASFWPDVLDKKLSYDTVSVTTSTILLSYIILFNTYQFTKILREFFWDYYLPKKRQIRLSALLIGFINSLIYLTCIFVILSYGFELPVGNAIAATGAVGVVLGFGLQKIITDLFIGISIDMDKSFQVGDWIRLKNDDQEIMGCITGMNWRSISVESTDSVVYQVPNNKFGDSIVTNLSLPNAEMEFAVFYQIPHDYNEKIVIETIGYGLEAAICAGVVLTYKCRVETITLDGITYKAKYIIRPDLVGPERAMHYVHSNVLRFLRSAGIRFATSREFGVHMLSPSMGVDKLLTTQDVANAGSKESPANALLSKIDLFQTLPDDQIQTLSSFVHKCIYHKGDVICAQGDMEQSLYIIREGLLKVFITDENGDQRQVAVLMPEDYFGEMSLLTGASRSATVIAESQLVVYELPAKALGPVFENNDKFHTIIAKTISDRQAINEKAAHLKDESEQIIDPIKELEEKIRNFFRKLLGLKN